VNAEAALYVSFGLVATGEPISAYMFAADCDVDESQNSQE